jgi:site-specific DNA recombinase
MVRKARAGQVTGGVFGYDNVDVMIPGPDGQPQRSHVERRIIEAEAAVIRRIFELSAEGRGVAAIAKHLNDRGARAPRPQRGRPAGWAPSRVREVLHRRLYAGEIVWNQSRKRDQWGVQRQRSRPERDWLRVRAPTLRVVDDELWQAAHTRLASARSAYLRSTRGRVFGRPRTGAESKHLLTGFGRCGSCVGGMFVHTRGHGHKGERRGFYACTAYHKRGRAVCANHLEIRIEAADRAILDGLRTDILHPAVFDVALDEALRLLMSPDEREGRRDAREAEVSSLSTEIERIVAAISAGGDLPALVGALQQKERRRQELAHELASDRQNALLRPDRGALRAELRRRLTGWRGLLARHPREARGILRLPLPEPIVFTPRLEGARRGYEYRGKVAIGRLIAGVLDPRSVASPAGVDSVCRSLSFSGLAEAGKA